MLPERHPKYLRWIERVLYAVLTVALGGVIWLYFSYELSWHEMYAALGVLILLVSLLVFVQRRYDYFVEIGIAQSSYMQEDAFESLYGRSPVAYLTIDRTGKIVEGNGAAAKLLHQEKGQLISSNFFSYVKPTDEINAAVLQSKVNAGLTINDLEITLTTALGDTIWAMFSAFSLRADGQRLISLIDVTQQKNIDTAKSEFVALATHQLRTPIAAIRWNVELLDKKLKDTKTEDQARYLTKIERNVIRMINLINDFLSVSKLEMGNYASAPSELNVSDFFGSILDEFAENISQKNISVNTSTEPSSLVINIDDRLFHIIVSNLVSNAVKYAKMDGNLTLTYELRGNELFIVVADDGIGVPENELSKLFTKFYRASNARSHQTEGTGLGLYIVKQSVEQLGGRISVSSLEDRGTKFEIELPATVVSAG